MSHTDIYRSFTILAQTGTMLDLLANGRWLTPERARIIAWATLTSTILMVAFLFWGAHGTLDYQGRPLSTDFSNVWTAGLMANEGRAATAWNWPDHYAVQQWAHHSKSVPFYGWHYPPPFLLIAVLLAKLPYIPSLILWQLATLAPMLWLTHRIVQHRDAILFAGGAPVVLICLGHGQNGFLTAGLLAAGLLLLDKRPWFAGVLLGCLVYKPQFAVLIPLVLIVRGNWRAVLGATGAVATLCGLTLALWGWPVWEAFFDSLTITRQIVIEQGNTGWEKIPSAFSAARMWGGTIPLAYAAQAIVTCLAVGLAAFVSRKGSVGNRSAAVMAAALLCTPYVLDYDLVVLTAAVAFLVSDIAKRSALSWEITLLAFAWIVPAFGRQLTAVTSIPLELIAIVAILVIAVRRAILLDGALSFRSSPFRRSHAASAL